MNEELEIEAVMEAHRETSLKPGNWRCGKCRKENEPSSMVCSCNGDDAKQFEGDPSVWVCECEQPNPIYLAYCSRRTCGRKRPEVYRMAPKSPESFEDAVETIVGELMEVMYSKRRDYGEGNIEAFGEIGVLIRASDKLARLKNLLYDNPSTKPNNESIEDSWGDLCNYAIIALLLRRGTFSLPLEGENNG